MFMSRAIFSSAVVLVSTSKGVWFPARDQSNGHVYEVRYTFVMRALSGGDCCCYSLTFLLKHSKKTTARARVKAHSAKNTDRKVSV